MSKKLWGGRFKKQIDKDFFEFEKSISYDYKLALFDVYHSSLHVFALYDMGLLQKSEFEKLISQLIDLREEMLKNEKEGKLYKYHKNSEDIHTDIHNRIAKKYPELAHKLHTLRSRNDQIAFDEKFYCLDKGFDVENLLIGMQKSLLFIGEKYMKQDFIGYTHTQRAQPVGFWNYMDAYMEMFGRDILRLEIFCKGSYPSIGAGALTGTAVYKKSYQEAAEKLAKDFGKWKVRPVKNTLDHVSDRDFIIEFLSILSIIQMHLSRLAEDFILYSTKEFNFFDLPEEFCTGSSLMPHKKNPDFLELVRGNTGKIYGNLMSILTTMKGLPLTYNRDMQLDKEPLFSSVETIENELKIMAKFVKGIKLNTNVIESVLREDIGLYATKIAEYLVIKEKVPFEQAHNKVGNLIKYLEGKSKEKITDEDLKKFHPSITKTMLRKITKSKFII